MSHGYTAARMRAGMTAAAFLIACSGAPERGGFHDPELVRTFRRHDGAVCSVAISPDGQYLATAGLDGKVVVTKGLSAAHLALEGEKDTGYPVMFGPDGSWFAVGGRKASIRRTTDGAEIATLPGHAWVYALAATRTEKGKVLLATVGGGDCRVKIWEAPRFRLVGELPHDEGVFAAAFVPHRGLAVTGTRELNWFDISKKFSRVKRVVAHTAPILSLAFDPDGRTLVSGTANGEVKIWTPEGPPDGVALTLYSDAVPVLLFSRDGSVLVTGSYDSRVRLFRRDGSGTFRRGEELRNPGGRVLCAALSPTSATLFLGCEDGCLAIFRGRR